MLILAALSLADASVSACPPPTRVTPAFVAQVTRRRSSKGTRLVWGTAPRSDDAPPQVLVFARDGAGWVAHAPGDTQDIVSAYRTGQGNRLILAFHTSGDPGTDFAGLLFDAQGRLLACPTIDFPAALNRDETTNERVWTQEYLTLDYVRIDRRGRGEMIARGDVEVGGQRWAIGYRYATHDGGQTWSEPVEISREMWPQHKR